MVVVGLDLGTQTLKAVVCDDRLEVLGTHSVYYRTQYPRPGWAEQDPRTWETALAPAVQGALAAAGVNAHDVAGLALAGQLDGCVPVDASGQPLHAALIWQDRRANDHVGAADERRVFEVAGQIADASHLAPKTRWLREQGIRAARYHVPVSYLVERLTGDAVLDPAHASTTMLYDLHAGTWSAELLSAFAVDASELPRIAPATALAGRLTAEGATITGLPVGTPVAVGTGDDFATPLGAGMVDPGRILCTLGTAEVVGALASTLVLDRPENRAASDPWHALAEPMVETHAFPTGGYFIENPGWLSGGAVRWASTLLGCATDAELDALAATAPPGADGVTFVPALAGAMSPQWRGHARGTIHGLTAGHGREHLARAVLEGLAFASRDVAGRLLALGLPGDEVVVLGGGARSALWLQIRADVLGLRHAVAARADACPIGAALLALTALGQVRDLRTAAAAMQATATVVTPAAGARDACEAAYERYRRLVGHLAPLADQAWS